MCEENKESAKEWCVWVHVANKVVYLRDTPNTKKISLESEEARVEFASRLLFKGYSIG